MGRTYLKNAPRLLAKLKALREQTAPAIRPTLADVAQKIVDLAKSLVPVESGDLRDSIGWTFGDAPKGALTIASQSVAGTKVTIFAGNAKAYYARWVEFGTKPHETGKGRVHPGNRAEPFFFPAYRALKKTVKAELGKAIRAVVKQVASKQS